MLFRSLTLKEAFVERKKSKHTKREAAHYRCASCEGEFPAKMVQVDHIDPVIDVDRGFVDWNTYIDRMFIDEAGLQVLCLKCHQEKSKKERKLRKK